jgi:glutathione peroxidase
MRKYLIIVIGVFMSAAAIGQNYFQLSFKQLNGDTESLNSYGGKKTMYIILPLTQTDPVFSQLQAFKDRYRDSVRVVGILSLEDGFQASQANNIQSMYNSMGIIISEGMNTKKTSGASQSAIMKWLTNKAENSHFDMDANGIGQKFFVNESGGLFAVLPVQASLQAQIIDKIVHSGAQ